eukprot:CAMPEP_0174934910 /NCGR_PEP_ID=MMETSP1355-20121228/51397_1 /TAXON_ID=464990 /ORGANISM="Hemiselmis tepida, Strain CCMP443" /LENGTH=37 /DNA_ID= /DNA_START= /DNA_END= /DNA_ORIENTATION=
MTWRTAQGGGTPRPPSVLRLPEALASRPEAQLAPSRG